MSVFTPDFVFNSVSDISIEFLASNNIKGLILDLDGTVCSAGREVAPDYSENWIKQINKSNIKLIMLSNNKRLSRVSDFCKRHGIQIFRHLAFKPLKHGFEWAAKKLELSKQNIAVVGDQIFTDVFGGNRAGMKTIFVHSIDIDKWYIKLRHKLEKKFLHKDKMPEKAKAGRE